MEKFTFGKYKGHTVDSVIDFQPAYVRWVISNVKFFTLSDEQKARLSRKYDEWKFYHTSQDKISKFKKYYVDDLERYTWGGVLGAGYE